MVRVDASVGNPDRFRERQWVMAVLEAAGPLPWEVVIVSGHTRHRSFPALEGCDPARTLCIALSGEAGVPRRDLTERAVVAQCYLHPDDASARLWPFPLGPSGFLPELPVVPWAQRDVPCSFVGALHPGRAGLYRGLTGRWWLPGPVPAMLKRQLAGLLPADDGSHLQFTDRFGSGLDGAAYAALLHRSRIALCPAGTRQVETFRHHEALRAGCVVVSPPLRAHPWTDGMPMVTVSSWWQIRPRVAALLADPARLAALHEETCRWWAERAGPAAIGRWLRARVLATAL